MVRAVTFIVLVACAHFVSADDPAQELEPDTKDIARLLERIKDLEQRVSQLEASAKQATPVAPGPQPRAPKYYPHVAPGPPTRRNGEPYSQPPAPNATHVPPTRPDSNVPRTWRPFYFNGQWYYIVPIDEAAARTGRAR